MSTQEKQLVAAAESAIDALADVLNAEYLAGNTDFPDVRYYEEVLCDLTKALSEYRGQPV